MSFPLRSLLLALALALPALPAQAEIRVTDITGREVVLEAPAQRLILGEARHLAVLGLLMDDPVALVAGWRQDKALDPPTLEAWRARFPAIDAIAPVGTGNRDISAETVIALAPVLVVLSLMDRGDAGMERARANRSRRRGSRWPMSISSRIRWRTRSPACASRAR